VTTRVALAAGVVATRAAVVAAAVVALAAAVVVIRVVATAASFEFYFLRGAGDEGRGGGMRTRRVLGGGAGEEGEGDEEEGGHVGAKEFFVNGRSSGATSTRRFER
jgi:hypothetical protein